MEDVGVRIDRKSSIESEPRTLTFDQIHFAREAALYVVNTRSVEEAITVFTEKKIGCKVCIHLFSDTIHIHYQGLEPVVSVAQGPTMDLGGEINSIKDHLQFTRIRDIVSAPF